MVSIKGDGMSEEREKRRRMVRSVAHSSTMDGLPLDAEAMELLYAIADGKITSEEARESILQKYRKKPE